MPQKNGPSRLGSFMAQSFIIDFASSRINDANLLIFTSGDQLGSVPVPAGAKHDIGVTVNVNQNLASANVPDDDLIVGSGGEEYV